MDATIEKLSSIWEMVVDAAIEKHFATVAEKVA